MTDQPSGARPWKVSQLSRNVFEVKTPFRRSNAWEQWLLLSGDRHWDNPSSDHRLQKKHLDEAKSRQAVVIDIGDLLCLMQGKYDPRSSKSALRPEHQVDNYIDAVINTAADFFRPYADNLVLIAMGNHESSIAKRLETNVTDRLIGALGGNVANGGFSGWVRFKFKEADAGENACSRVLNLHYDHGYGGGGPVTADMIQHQRRAIYLPDADIVVSGHTHDAWTREFVQLRLTKYGQVRQSVQTHIKVPTYKDDYKDGYGGWHAETGKPPKPLGAYWVRFYWDHSVEEIKYEVIRAA